jgi:hypothetical protein
MSDYDAYVNRMKENYNAMEKRDADAKAKGTIVGRYVAEPYADGYAYYEILWENKATVTAQVITGIGDDWVIPYWGRRAKIDRAYALRSLRIRDTYAEIFSKCKKADKA